MWTNPERYRSSSTPAQPTYFSTPVPTVREDILNVQAEGRLAAHLRETPAPHILEEDAEPNEDLAGGDFTYSQETTTTFQELLTLIDSNTRELPSVLSPTHYAALTQLPLTYAWARLCWTSRNSFSPLTATCSCASLPITCRVTPILTRYCPLKFSPASCAAPPAYHRPP